MALIFSNKIRLDISVDFKKNHKPLRGLDMLGRFLVNFYHDVDI